MEVSFSRYRERGSIDVLAFRAEARALLVVEVKSVAPDMQSTLMGVDRKGRLGPSIARERGWDPAVTGRLLVLWDTRTNRRRIEARDATVRAAMPARDREVQRWLADPGPPGLCGIWFVPNAQGQDATGIRVQRVRRLRARVPREVPPDS